MNIEDLKDWILAILFLTIKGSFYLGVFILLMCSFLFLLDKFPKIAVGILFLFLSFITGFISTRSSKPTYSRFKK